MMQAFRQSSMIICMVIFRILVLLVAFKFLSLQYGPKGFGILSQIMAVSALFSIFAGGGLSNGLVREIASASDEEERSQWLKSGLHISFVSAGLLSIIGAMLYFVGSQTLLDNNKLAWIFILMGVAQIVAGIGNTATAYLNGINAVRITATAGIVGSFCSLAFVVGGSYLFGFSGAVFGCAVLSFVPSVISLLFLILKIPGKIGLALTATIDHQKTKKLLSYSLAMVVAVGAVPFALIYMRLQIGDKLGWEAVGYWQSVARIGDAYIQVFGALFISILLPKLAAAPKSETLTLMASNMLPIFSLFVLGGLIFWLTAPIILGIVYSREFAGADIFVLPQLLADGFKILASFFVYRFLAIGKPNIQAAGEVIQAATMVFVFVFLLPKFVETKPVWSYVAGSVSVFIFVILMTAIDHYRTKRS